MATYQQLQDPIIQAFPASTMTLTNDGLSITIARRVWAPYVWNALVMLLVSWGAQGLSWIARPSWIPVIPGQPRWKRLSCDGLTRLLYALLIPPTHPLRALFEAFDWAWIDGQCAPPYRNRHGGAPAYAPQMLFRVLVLMFVSGTPFESATLARLRTDVAWRWFVGLNLWCRVPDAGTLSRFRARVGVECFEDILTELILVCDRAGLVGHEESYYDMTGVRASATRATPYQRAVILSRALSVWLDAERSGVGTLEREQVAAIALEVLSAHHPSLKTVSPAHLVVSQDAPGSCVAEARRSGAGWWQPLLTALARQPRPVSEGTADLTAQIRQVATAVLPDVPQAFGDQDASVGHTRTDGSLCGYRSGFLVDAKRRIITAVIVVTLTATEAPTVLSALTKHAALFGRHPRRLGLDSAFDVDAVHQYLEAHEIVGGITVRSRSGPVGVFHVDAFLWDPHGQLRCPHNDVMTKVAGPYKDGTDRYRATTDCAVCPLRDQCLTEDKQAKTSPRRELRMSTAAHQRAQRNRERSRSPEGRALRRQRFAAEGVFGHANRFHNGDKTPYRTGRMTRLAQLMVAFILNLETLAFAQHEHTAG
jgi:transposase